ncbi:MAG: hypothetical protein ACRDGH_06830 [Candidatus Limnocylindria bacterium]
MAPLQAEPAWIEQTVSRLKENATMQTHDVKKDRKVLYAPKPGEFAIIDVPEMAFLMIDGER